MTRFAPIVVLALLGVLIPFSSTPQASGTSSLHARDLLDETNTEIFNPIVAPTPVSAGFTVGISPNTPKASAVYTLEFVAPHNLILGLDEIIITWDQDFKDFPTGISTSAVTIRAVGDGGGCGNPGEELPSCGVIGGFGNEGQSVAPAEVFVTVDNKGQTRLRVPDMDTDDNTGGNGIKLGANVTVVFTQSAGITNPSEGNDNYEIELRVTDGSGVDGGTIDDIIVNDIFIQSRMIPSSNDGQVGDLLTVVASGIEGGGSITFWRDANGDGVRQAGEFDLCVLVANSDDTATCTFTIFSPLPMVPGKGTDCSVVATDGDGLGDCNFINFLDSQGRNTTGADSDTLDQAAVDRQTFELTTGIPTPTPSPAACTPPGSGDWIVSASCTFEGTATAPANVIVEAGIALTIDTGASLDINFTNFHLLIRSGAKVVIKDGGKIH